MIRLSPDKYIPYSYCFFYQTSSKWNRLLIGFHENLIAFDGTIRLITMVGISIISSQTNIVPVFIITTFDKVRNIGTSER